MSVRATLAGLALAVAVPAAAGAPPPAVPEASLAAITAPALLADVAFLSGPDLDGRAAGSPGYWRAARWAAERFAALGLEPAGDDGFLQRFTCEHNEFLAAPRLRVTGPDGASRACRLGADFVARGFSGSGAVDAEVAFVGYGLALPERGWDDYAGVDVAGKVVLCFKRNPTWTPDGAPWDEDSGTPRVKSAMAAARGARALLWCELPPPGQAAARPPIGSVLHGPGPHPAGFPQLEVSEEVADALLGGAGEARRLRDRLDADRTPQSRPLAARVDLEVRAAHDPARATCNVVGVLRGGDPALRDEAVILGAHLDHVGRQAPDFYFPGANDNASGSAAVLRLAEAFARADRRPTRTVVFALFSGEEAGLEGARRHAAAPVLPLADTVAMLNLDCCAHGDSIQVGSGKTSPAEWDLARALDEQGARLMVARTWPGGGADATPFHEAGVRTLYWATTRSYDHLHQPSDRVETLNGPLYEALVRLALRTAWALADAPAGGLAPAADAAPR